MVFGLSGRLLKGGQIMTVISNPDDVPVRGTPIKVDVKRFLTDSEYLVSIMGKDIVEELATIIETKWNEEVKKEGS
jgi:hypothetical protein